MEKKLITFLGVMAFFLSTVTPTFAATTIQVSGNGFNSINHVTINSNSSSSTSQNNLVAISNHINSTSSTGGNNANGNTSGNVTIHTGNSSSNTTISTHANINIASVGCCNGQCK